MEEYAKIYNMLLENMPNAKCELDYTSPFELLIAVILSAQCTDKRVNIVTKELFEICGTAESMAITDIEILERCIKPCGFYKVKAANIKATARKIVESYNGKVPNTLAKLMTLPGVGRKTANVIMAEIYGVPAIAVDTHVFRVSRRLAFSIAETPEGVERDLMRLFPPDEWIKLHHLLIHQGRYVCKAQKPLCGECSLKSNGLCSWGNNSKKLV